jgi:hypothetical protein
MWVRLPTQIQWQNSNWRSNERGKKIDDSRSAPFAVSCDRVCAPAQLPDGRRHKAVAQCRRVALPYAGLIFCEQMSANGRSGRAPAPPASYAGKGRQRQGARSCASSRSQLTLSSAMAMLEDIHRDVVRLMMRVSPLQAQTW